MLEHFQGSNIWHAFFQGRYCIVGGGVGIPHGCSFRAAHLVGSEVGLTRFVPYVVRILANLMQLPCCNGIIDTKGRGSEGAQNSLVVAEDDKLLEISSAGEVDFPSIVRLGRVFL